MVLDQNFDPVVAATALLGQERPDGSRRYDCSDLTSADRNGLLGTVVAQVRSGRITLDADARSLLDAMVHRSASLAVILEARAAAGITELNDAGVQVRVLKGAAVAHLDYSEPALRPFGDVDLLIRGDDMGTAVEVLADHGFRRHFAEPFDGFDRQLGKGVAVEDDSGMVFDLHRTLALGYYGTRLPVDDLWRSSVQFELAGVQASALGQTHRFVHCALHMALSPTPKFVNAIDLGLIGRGTETLTTAEVLEVAGKWGCLQPLALAVQYTNRLFGDSWTPSELATWARQRTPSLPDRLAMSAFNGPLASSRLRSLTSIAGMRSNTLRWNAFRRLVRGHHDQN